MFEWFRRRQGTEAARRRLLIALARAEEELLETHVQNALDVYDAVADDLSLDQALAVYLDTVTIDESQATTVARMVIARLESSDSRVRQGRRSRPRRHRR